MAHLTPIDVLEKQLLEIIREANTCVNTGNRVRPHNTYVGQMQNNARNVADKATAALATLGQVRGEYALRNK